MFLLARIGLLECHCVCVGHLDSPNPVDDTICSPDLNYRIYTARVPAVDCSLPEAATLDFGCSSMTLGELIGCKATDKKMPSVGEALEHLLEAAKRQQSLAVGVYESAKLMNVDPDSVVLCLLATDEEDEGDIALQIHFTLIQAFCCDNDINIVRVSGMQKLEEILGSQEEMAEPLDLHCILVTNSHMDSCKSQGLEEVASFCEQSRCLNQWVPSVSLQDR